MEIGPIPAIRAVPVAKILKPGPRFSELLEIEDAPEPMKDTLSHDENQTARGQDSESEKEDQGHPEGENAERQGSGSTVNVFA
jgi:hypothetical protein